MRRRRVPVERGWDILTLEDIVVANTSVDNVGTVLEELYNFDDFVDTDDTNILEGQDRRAEYFIERLHLGWSFNAAFAAGNALGALPVWFGLLVGDKATLDGLDNFAGLVGTAFWSANWREANFVRNIVRVKPYLTYERYGVESSDNLTSINNYDGAANPWFKELDVKNLHLKRGEALYVAMSQTGLAQSDSYQSWVDGDAVRLDAVVSTLVRKKRDR